MGADDKGEVFNIRITVSDKNPQTRIQQFIDKNPVTLACLEMATCSHIHAAYVVAKPVCKSTVRARMAKFLDLSGNEDFSLIPQKEGEQIAGLYRYICKGNGPDWDTQAPVIIKNQLDAINVKMHHTDYWAVQTAFIKETKNLAKQRETEKRKKKTKIVHDIATRHKNSIIEGNHIDMETIESIVTDIITEYKGDVNDNTLFTAMQSVCWSIDPTVTAELAFKRMKAKLLSKYSL